MRLEESIIYVSHYNVMDGGECIGVVHIKVDSHNELNREMIESWIVKSTNQLNEAVKCLDKR